MINVITNSMGSGDWVAVRDTKTGSILFEGHRITPMELASILEQLGHETDLVALTDEEMEEGTY